MPDRTPSPQELGPALLLLARARGELVARFSGASMRPALRDGVELRLRHLRQPAAGDIVAFVAGDRVILHRVEAVSARHASLLTRGDALWLPDPPLRDPEAIVGVVVGVREGAAFAPPPPAPRGLLREAVLLPFRAAHGASPSATAFVLESLRLPGRTARWCLATLRRLAHWR